MKEIHGFLLSFIAFLRNCIRFVLLSVRKNLLLVILITAAGCAGSYYYWRHQPAYYESQMVCSFNNMHKKTFGEMVHRLDLLAQSRSYGRLSSLLGITTDQAKTIIAFDARNIAGSPLYEDITTEKLPMYFTLRATDPAVFGPVQKGLLDYLNGSPYQRLRTKLDREKTLERIVYLDASIRKLDSVIDACAAFLRQATVIRDSGGIPDIVSMFRYKEELENKKLDEIQLSGLVMSVEPIYGFAPADHPLTKGYGYLIKMFAGCFALAVFVVVFKEMLGYGR